MNKQHLLCTLLLAGSAALTLAGSPPAPLETPAEESKALGFPVSYTGEVLGNLSGGYKQGAVYEGLLNIGVEGDLEKLAGWKGASFLVSGLYPHGASLTDKYVHDFNAVSNIDAYDSPALYEVWLQQELFDGKLSIRLGNLLADSEFFISDSAALFLNGAFGAIPLVSQNFSALVYPIPAPGARVRWTINESWSLQGGVYDGVTGDPASGSYNHGTEWRLNGSDGVLALSELAYTHNPDGLSGVYKLGVFYHSSVESDAFPNNGSRASAGGYVIADQTLWRETGTEDQGLTGFLRIGGAPANRNVVPFYFDAGFNYKGLLPGRDADVAGLGFSYTKASNDLLDEFGNGFERHHEATLELTYKVQATEWLTFQPDVQYVFNPGAFEKADNALVAGVRFNVSF